MRTLTLWTRDQVSARFGEEIANHALLSSCGIAQDLRYPPRLIVGISESDHFIHTPTGTKTHALVFKVDEPYIRRNHSDGLCGINTFLACADDGRLPPDDRVQAIYDELRKRRGDQVTVILRPHQIQEVFAEELPSLEAILSQILTKLQIVPTLEPSISLRLSHGRFVLTVQVAGETKTLDLPPETIEMSNSSNDQVN